VHELAVAATGGGLRRLVGQTKVYVPVEFWHTSIVIICPSMPPVMVEEVTAAVKVSAKFE
jgi:hypothetical protein